MLDTRQVLKCNNYEKINRRVNKLTNVSHHNVIAYFSKKKNRVLAGKTKFGTWLLDAHGFGENFAGLYNFIFCFKAHFCHKLDEKI